MRLRDWTLQYNLIWAAHSEPPTNCACPDGYKPYNEECLKETIVPALQPPDWNPMVLVRKQYNQYGMYGMKLFDEGYPLNGAGDYTLYKDGYDFWWNYSGYPYQGLDGPMNRCGLWTQVCSAGQQMGFSVCFNVGADKTYYVGFGVDNYTTIRIDGEAVLIMDPIENATTFRYWHVYPVRIKKGFHVLEVIGNNKSSIAAVGVQIYDVSVAQLLAVSDHQQLESYLVFDTEKLIGQTHTLGNGAYSIEAEYSLVLCDGTPYYRKVEYTPCQ